MTGVVKFGGLDEIADFSNKNAAYANTIVYLNSGGIFDLSTIDNRYVNESVLTYVVRIQNVPRGWVGTYLANRRRGEVASAKLLANSLREIEFSLKIALGADAKEKIKEETLTELRATDLVQTLLSVMKTSSLLTLCDGFGLCPTLE